MAISAGDACVAPAAQRFVISHQPRDERFARESYKRRNVIERLVGWLKERCRLCTRFEKLAQNYLAMVKLAFIEKCLILING